METLSFTLGVLSVIIVAFIAVLVWGVVKVVKQEKQIKNMNDDFSRSIENIYRNITENNNYAYRKFEDMDRHAHEQMKNYIAESKSYTDSRIDKLLEKKQVIKG